MKFRWKNHEKTAGRLVGTAQLLSEKDLEEREENGYNQQNDRAADTGGDLCVLRFC